MGAPKNTGGKFIETYVLNHFSRPFGRKLHYIYTGLDHARDIFVLSNTEDTEFKYCEPGQTTGMIQIHNREHLAAMRTWLTRFGFDDDEPRLIYLSELTAALNKTSWDSPDITIRRDNFGCVYLALADRTILASRPIDTHFTLTKLQEYVGKYTAAFFAATVPSHAIDLPDADKAARVTRLPVSCQALHDAGVLDSVCPDLNLVLRPGQDYLLIKSIMRADMPYSSGVRLWADGGPRCINYGGFFSSADVSLNVVRDNIFVFPKVSDRSMA